MATTSARKPGIAQAEVENCENALKVDESKHIQMDFAKMVKHVQTSTGGGGGSRGTIRKLRIREDTAYYDLKSRSMREDPLLDMYAVKNQSEISGQALEFKRLNIHVREAFEKGHDVPARRDPSQAELKVQTNEVVIDKYDNDAASEATSPRKLL
ncbi:pre-mrna-splicing factor slu7 [Nicotiana attenuata]|uniref:Pre-mRNA-splicing factor SLU7 n=1 Tax=Nicotiana attenuata TaxID=49451 RepID=A0A314L7Q7_NICAT|nr:pre-mrna-splicing factor slu7 [Nicotiana attenuata]